MHRAHRAAGRPAVRREGDRPPALTTEARPAKPQTRRLPDCSRAEQRRRDRCRQHRTHATVQRSQGPARPVRHRRRCPWLPSRARAATHRARLHDHPRRRRPSRRRCSRGPPRGVRRRPGRPRAGHSRRTASRHGHGCQRQRVLRTGQPRGQAAPRAPRQERQDQPRARDDTRAARAGAAGVPRPGRNLHRRADLALRVRRRQAGRLARRPGRAHARSCVRPGAFVLPVRRDDGRDRRVRAARAVPVGERLPRSRDGRLRPHADARAGVDQQHDLPRHRLCLRRLADRAPLSRARAGVGQGGRGVLRAGQTVACSNGTVARTRRTRADRRDRAPGDRDRDARATECPRGAGRCGARGDEPGSRSIHGSCCTCRRR